MPMFASPLVSSVVWTEGRTMKLGRRQAKWQETWTLTMRTIVMRKAPSSSMPASSRNHLPLRRKRWPLRWPRKQPQWLCGASEANSNYLPWTLPPPHPLPLTASPLPSVASCGDWASSLPHTRARPCRPHPLTHRTTRWPPAPDPELRRDSP